MPNEREEPANLSFQPTLQLQPYPEGFSADIELPHYMAGRLEQTSSTLQSHLQVHVGGFLVPQDMWALLCAQSQCTGFRTPNKIIKKPDKLLETFMLKGTECVIIFSAMYFE